jgi:hypothetical protein
MSADGEWCSVFNVSKADSFLPFLTDLTLLHAIKFLFLSRPLYILGSVTPYERIRLCVCEEDKKM